MLDHFAATSLRRYLDAGHLLEDSGVDLEWLAEGAIRDRLTLTPEQRREQAARLRDMMGIIVIERPHLCDEARFRGWAWRAELETDDELCTRVEDALPSEICARYRAWAVEEQAAS